MIDIVFSLGSIASSTDATNVKTKHVVIDRLECRYYCYVLISLHGGHSDFIYDPHTSRFCRGVSQI